MGTPTNVFSVALPILGGNAFRTALAPAAQEALAVAFLAVRPAGSDALVFFTGAGSIVFFFLLLRARYLPRPLALWGLLSYATCIVFPVLKLLSPPVARFETWVYSPGALFEIVVGAWLLLKGIEDRAVLEAIEPVRHGPGRAGT